MKTLGKSLILGAMLLAGASQAQTVRINGLVELSGTGATSGTNFDNGIKLAVKEINAAGGILGRKVDYVSYDTQSQPGVAKALAQKAVDENAYVVMGPVFTGSIMVSMAETRRAEIPNFTGGEGASITQQGNPYIFRTSFTQATAMPKIANYIRDAVKAKSVDVVDVDPRGGQLPGFDRTHLRDGEGLECRRRHDPAHLLGWRRREDEGDHRHGSNQPEPARLRPRERGAPDGRCA